MSSYIESANTWAAQWASVLWRASWQGAVFIFAIWLVCQLFRQIPASTRHWLWLLAATQLLIRLFIASPIALPVLPASRSTSVASADQMDAKATEVRSSFTTPITPQPSHSASVTTLNPHQTTGQVHNSTTVQVAQAGEQHARPSLALAGLAIWIFGVGASLVASTRRLLRTRLLLNSLIQIEDGRVSLLAAELSALIGVRTPPVYESACAPCPLLAGWFRSTIVLPAGSTRRLSDSELRMAIAHELFHLRRRDLWFGFVPVMAQILFFFHPLAWLAAHEATAAREESCDTEALKLSGGSPAAYARLLLNSAQCSSTAAVLGTAFGYRLIQRRINMLRTSTRAYGVSARRAFSLLVVLGAVCALPWTVTAQSSQTGGTKHAHSKKHAPARKASKIKSKLVGVAHPVKSNALAKRSYGTGVVTSLSTGVTNLGLAQPVPSSVGRAVPATPSLIYKGQTGTAILVPPSPAPRKIGNPPASVPSAPQLFRSPPIARPFVFRSPPTAPPNATEPGGSLVPPTPSANVGFPSERNAPLANPTNQSLLPAPPSNNSGGFPTVAAHEPNVTIDGNGLEVNFDEVEIHTAIKELFKAMRLSYMIKSGIKKDTVTMSLHQTTIEIALQTLLRSVHEDLTYRIEADVYTIVPRDAK